MIRAEEETSFFRISGEDETEYRWNYICKNNDWEVDTESAISRTNRDIDSLFPVVPYSCKYFHSSTSMYCIIIFQVYENIKNAGKHCFRQKLPIFFLVKYQIVNILRFEGHMPSLAMIQHCNCRIKSAINTMEINRHTVF